MTENKIIILRGFQDEFYEDIAIVNWGQYLARKIKMLMDAQRSLNGLDVVEIVSNENFSLFDISALSDEMYELLTEDDSGFLIVDADGFKLDESKRSRVSSSSVKVGSGHIDYEAWIKHCDHPFQSYTLYMSDPKVRELFREVL